MKSFVKNYRQSPRKVRLVADLVRGKDSEEAIVLLSFTPKRAASAISKAIKSARANAENNFSVNSKNLFIEKITIDEGTTLKRWRARARGQSARILKRSSHISIELKEKENEKKNRAELSEKKKENTEKMKKKKAVSSLPKGKRQS